jgi:hypothetical protein
MLDAVPPQDKVQATFDALLKSRDLLVAEEFMQRLAWTRETLDAAVNARRLFFVEVGGVTGFPAFYLDKRFDRQELESVTQLLGDLSGGSKWLFFTRPRASLSAPIASSPTALARAGQSVELRFPIENTYIGPSGLRRTALEALEAGEVAFVRRAAAGYAEA